MPGAILPTPAASPPSKRAAPRFAAAVVVALAAAFSLAPQFERTPDTRAADLPKTIAVDLGAGVTMDFILAPAGSFTMGSPDETGDADEGPQHRVTITRPFYLGKYEVTQEQWQQVMGANPSSFRGARLPVDSVSWNDCHAFLEKLSAKTGRRFALPSEAQWEYACRAGTTTPWNFGAQPAPATDYAWCMANAQSTTHPVGRKGPNGWGFYDMAGNIAEWCADWYGRYPKQEETIDPHGPPKGDSRVVRGGAWGDDPLFLRSAYRNANGPDGANDGIGFRCAMRADPPAKDSK